MEGYIGLFGLSSYSWRRASVICNPATWR